jgi:hypothetical protein
MKKLCESRERGHRDRRLWKEVVLLGPVNGPKGEHWPLLSVSSCSLETFGGS